ncbi:cathelicidin-related antimicrobial peptide Bf-CRAMP-like [Ranitomeya variabilis]|uniref:cathelicidin-related antimicrobial peptide Bf-CRAMP-like n=1 Tax=Ranitomeya variabilis TaxID=490064 RepID=UPI004056DAD2
MRSWRLSLLLLSAVTLHGCLSDAADPEIKDGRSIGDITDLYNQKEGVTYLYKSLDQIHISPSKDTKSFLIKETVCLKSENLELSQCDFKPDGDVKICTLHLGDEDPVDKICISLTTEGEKSDRRSFVLKETVCLKSEDPDLSQCDFKPDGDVKICSLDVSDENPGDIMCISQTQDVRVKRSSRKPCRKKPCPPGGYSVIGRKAKTQNGTEIDEE